MACNVLSGWVSPPILLFALSILAHRGDKSACHICFGNDTDKAVDKLLLLLEFKKWKRRVEQSRYQISSRPMLAVFCCCLGALILRDILIDIFELLVAVLDDRINDIVLVNDYRLQQYGRDIGLSVIDDGCCIDSLMPGE